MKTLAQLGEREDDAKKVLEALISSENTKLLLELDEIRGGEAGQQSEQTAILLGELLNRRLVRTIGGAYELSHEYIAPEIASWLEDEQREIKQIQDDLRADLTKWRVLGLMMGAETLARVERHIDNPHLHLSQDEIDLLSRSALCASRDAEPFIKRLAPDRMLNIFLATLNDKNPNVQLAALRVLRTSGLATRKALTQLATMCRSRDERVRAEAQSVMRELHPSAGGLIAGGPASTTGPDDRHSRICAVVWLAVFEHTHHATGFSFCIALASVGWRRLDSLPAPGEAAVSGD